MRKIALWVSAPAVLGIVGAVLWFTCGPGRSGAG